MPYFASAIAVLAVAVYASLMRGDRVMRLGVIGAATTTLPWALCSGLVACTTDPDAATRWLRLGQGPVSLVGPNMFLVLLGVSGQLEAHRWLARMAGLIGLVLLAACWGTDLVVPGVQQLPSGLLYLSPGPLTDLHTSQIAIWLGIGIVIVRRSSAYGEKRRLARMLILVLALGAVGSLDMLIVHGVWRGFPIAWLPATAGALFALYLVRYTELLRPRGIDRSAVAEAVAFGVAAVVIGAVSFAMGGTDPVTHVVIASAAWVGALGVSWMVVGRRPVRVAADRALEQFVARLADLDDEQEVVARLAALWASIGVGVRRAWRTEGTQLVDVAGDEAWALDHDVAAWLVDHGQAIAPGDLATMRLGAIRPGLEALVGAHGATLVIPLIDRGDLVGLIEADHGDALREEERGLVVESSRAAARAITYAALARAAATEGETAREVEVAEAMRLQASASRDDELGRWTVAAEYRSAPRTTGAGWSTTLLPDGRLAVLVTEAQAHGVAAALATAALKGAFTAATSGTGAIVLDDLVTSLRASADGVMRGGEPIAAFLAVLDADRQSIAWACAGHPGGFVVGPVAFDLSTFPLGSKTGPGPRTTVLGGGGAALGASLVQATRGETPLPADSLLVITSTAVRGDDEQRWQLSLREHAPAGPRLATVLVELALRRAETHEDFLAVVVRQRPDRPSERVISR